jgi:GntR family transcriptional regulator
MVDMDLPPVRDRRPLAVQVYDRIFDAVSKSGSSASALPTEEDLTRQLGVSRTTVRQALALLEEDGIIERGPGRRRHVAGMAPSRPGTVVPLEEMLRSPADATVTRKARTVSPATEWNARLLGLRRGEEIVTWQSDVLVGDRLVASALEFIKADQEPVMGEGDRTMFSSLGAQYHVKATMSSLRISPYVNGSRGFKVRDPRQGLMALTYTTQAPSKPTYLAKHVVDIGAVPVELMPGAISGAPEATVLSSEDRWS